MKTDELISLLATGADQVPAHTIGRRFALALGIGLPTTALLMLLTMGLRADFIQAAMGWAFWLKLAFTACLAVGGWILTGRLSRPGMKVGFAWVTIALPLLVVWLAAAGALFAGVPEQRLGMLLGSSWKSCPWNIAALSLPLFIATFWCVKDLAPTRLAMAGAASGLMSGALSASVYALHCTETAAPFIGVWYVLGITIPTVIGASLAPRLLRW
jgi:hypothetical protein